MHTGEDDEGDVGICISRHACGAYVITSTILEGPGASGEILPGDLLLSVDGVETRGRSPAQVLALLEGPLHESVALAIARPRIPGDYVNSTVSVGYWCRKATNSKSIHNVFDNILIPGSVVGPNCEDRKIPMQVRETNPLTETKAVGGLLVEIIPPYTVLSDHLVVDVNGLTRADVGYSNEMATPGDQLIAVNGWCLSEQTGVEEVVKKCFKTSHQTLQFILLQPSGRVFEILSFYPLSPVPSMHSTPQLTWTHSQANERDAHAERHFRRRHSFDDIFQPAQPAVHRPRRHSIGDLKGQDGYLCGLFAPCPSGANSSISLVSMSPTGLSSLTPVSPATLGDLKEEDPFGLSAPCPSRADSPISFAATSPIILSSLVPVSVAALLDVENQLPSSSSCRRGSVERAQLFEYDLFQRDQKQMREELQLAATQHDLEHASAERDELKQQAQRLQWGNVELQQGSQDKTSLQQQLRNAQRQQEDDFCTIPSSEPNENLHPAFESTSVFQPSEVLNHKITLSFSNPPCSSNLSCAADNLSVQDFVAEDVILEDLFEAIPASYLNDRKRPPVTCASSTTVLPQEAATTGPKAEMLVSPLEAVLSSSSPLEAVLSSSSRGTNREHTYDGKAGQPNSENQCGQELKAKQLVADAPQPRVLQVLSTDRQEILEILGRAQAQRASAEEQQQLEENVARVNERLRQLQENARVKERIKQLQAIDAQLRPRRYAGMLPTDYSTGYIGEEKRISECIQDTLAGTLDEEDRGKSSVKGGVYTSPVETDAEESDIAQTDAEESDIAHMPRGPRGGGEGFEQGPRPASYTPQSGGPESNTGGGVTVVEGVSQSPVSPLDFGMIETLGISIGEFFRISPRDSKGQNRDSFLRDSGRLSPSRQPSLAQDKMSPAKEKGVQGGDGGVQGGDGGAEQADSYKVRGENTYSEAIEGPDISAMNSVGSSVSAWMSVGVNAEVPIELTAIPSQFRHTYPRPAPEMPQKEPPLNGHQIYQPFPHRSCTSLPSTSLPLPLTPDELLLKVQTLPVPGSVRTCHADDNGGDLDTHTRRTHTPSDPLPPLPSRPDSLPLPPTPPQCTQEYGLGNTSAYAPSDSASTPPSLHVTAEHPLRNSMRGAGHLAWETQQVQQAVAVHAPSDELDLAKSSKIAKMMPTTHPQLNTCCQEQVAGCQVQVAGCQSDLAAQGSSDEPENSLNRLTAEIDALEALLTMDLIAMAAKQQQLRLDPPDSNDAGFFV